jgi:hypothetical protein
MSIGHFVSMKWTVCSATAGDETCTATHFGQAAFYVAGKAYVGLLAGGPGGYVGPSQFVEWPIFKTEDLFVHPFKQKCFTCFKPNFKDPADGRQELWVLMESLVGGVESDILSVPLTWNSLFPWEESQLYFTSVFPAINQKLQTNCTEHQLNGAFKARQFDKFCEYYGWTTEVLSKLDDVMTKYVSAAAYTYKPPNNDPNSAAYKAWQEVRFKLDESYAKSVKEFKVLIKENMQKNYFEKTGWGLVLPANDRRFNLFPGAVPAAQGRSAQSDTPWDILPGVTPPADPTALNVYLPGHCEPPEGGTDSDTGAESVTLLSINSTEGGGYPKSYSTGPPYGSDPDFSSMFLMPWVDGQDRHTKIESFGDKKGYKDTTGLVFAQPTVDFVSDPKRPIIGQRVGSADGVGMDELASPCMCGPQGVKQSDEECNGALVGTPWDWTKYEKYTQQQLDNLKIDGKDVINLCKLAKDSPQCLIPVGTDGCVDNGDDLEKDCNLCTHNAGYQPRGDLYNDKRSEALVTYNLTDKLSTGYSKGGTGVYGEPTGPTATDVTPGLYTFNKLTGTFLSGRHEELTAYYNPLPPRVAAPDASKVSANANALSISLMDAFSVNNLPKGKVYLGSGQGIVTLRFYAWAAHDQGPINAMYIDWGDGQITKIEDIQMKNQKPFCETEKECAGIDGFACTGDGDCPVGTGTCLSLGKCERQQEKVCRIAQENNRNADCGLLDRCLPRIMYGNSQMACRQGYLEFLHVYQAPKNLPVCVSNQKRCMNEPNLTEGSCKTAEGEIAVDYLVQQGGCMDTTLKMARYTPRVMIKDSWGWCTGNCYTQGEEVVGRAIRHPLGGCWDGSKTKINNEVVNDPMNSQVLENECSTEKITASSKNRPWIIFQGSVDLSISD